jgi:hypothetical protein
MDYEKAYKNALQLAKSYYDKGTNEFLDTIFPELAESDDERIRGGLSKFLWGVANGEVKSMPSASQCQEWLSYLERQKEPKPGTTEDNPIDPFDTKLFQDGVKEGRRLEREDMRKPFSCGHENGSSEKPNNQWSEDIIRKAVKEVGLTQHQIDWFKTNVFPPKQEWSAEDERMLVGIIERGSAQIPPSEPALREEQMEWLMNRLKSLRSRPKVSDNWKPSSAQIETLDIASRKLCGDGYIGLSATLDSLAEELKQLK